MENPGHFEPASKVRPLRIWCLTHVPFEGPGLIADWAQERGHDFQITRLWEGDPLPAWSETDLLVVMGGPMSVHDEEQFPWLRAEKQLVRECLEGGRYVLGVCLGSQILAECQGATVRRNNCREIGWFPIRVSVGPESVLRDAAPEFVVFHWHGETYDLPPGAAQCASSKGCDLQAFEYPLALGLQFHLEMQPASVEGLLTHCGHEIGTGAFEQDPAVIRGSAPGFCSATRPQLWQLMNRIEERID